MSHLPIDHSATPIRLFRSDFLEFFTHISPLVVLIIWLPVAVFFLLRPLLAQPAGFPLLVPLGVLIGLFVWTFAEYTMHRFVFHYRPRSPWQERVTFLFHGIHHAQPQCKTRLVMPPAVSIPMALRVLRHLLRAAGARAALAPQWVDPLFAGFILGYLAYDMIHYATHHFAMRSGALKFLKRYHMAAPLQDPQPALRRQLAALGRGLRHPARLIIFPLPQRGPHPYLAVRGFHPGLISAPDQLKYAVLGRDEKGEGLLERKYLKKKEERMFFTRENRI